MIERYFPCFKALPIITSSLESLTPGIILSSIRSGPPAGYATSISGAAWRARGHSSLASLTELLTPRLTIYQLPLVFEECKRNSIAIGFRKDCAGTKRGRRVKITLSPESAASTK